MKIYPIVTILLLAQSIVAQTPYNAPQTGNPILPGYFADPTVKKFADTYYIYATTDGAGAGFGPSQVWTSKDFVNWTIMPMNWPTSHWIWAPDVMQKDNKYYMVYCQPCNLYMAESETPRGPWTNVLGTPEAVLVPDRFVTNAITLDGQTFIDDDGTIYMYWGTWGIYKGFGCGAGKLNSDMKSFSETKLIPNTEITDFFEAPFVLKRNGTYYFMYSSESCHNETYHVQYATADNPLGPYTYKGTILKTNDDGTVHGPGHHSVLQDVDKYYIIYHRHDNPHSNRGFHRQVCADAMQFDAEGNIIPIKPSHSGIGTLAPLSIKSNNLALGKKTIASSFYDDNFRPEYASDDNNGTLWRPKTIGHEWIQIDLGKLETIKTIQTQFEYATHFYQYIIETSSDGTKWQLFADKRNNRLAGSPMTDFGNIRARYVRLTYIGGQKKGFGGAIWNIKIYPEIETYAPQQWIGATAADFDGVQWNNNEGMLGKYFEILKGSVTIKHIAGREALVIEPNSKLRLTHQQITKKGKHTISISAYDGEKWTLLSNTDDFVSESAITIKTNKNQLIISDIRYYNYEQSDAEKEFNASQSIVRHEPANNHNKGLIVSIDANNFNLGDTVMYIPNKGIIGGEFEYDLAHPDSHSPAVVENIEGKLAFRFDGKQIYRSNFMLPNTMRDNTPYTLDAWIYNPKMAENECIIDFTSTHDELEKIMLANGTEPRCGLLNHYGWFEDVGIANAKQFEDKWQHIVVQFDGRIERVYINDELISEKDIQLLIKPSQYIMLGINAEGVWPFSGYIHSIKLIDNYM